MIPDYVLKKLLEHAERGRGATGTTPEGVERTVIPPNLLVENIRDVTQAAVYLQEDLGYLKGVAGELKEEDEKLRQWVAELQADRIHARFLVKLLAGVMALMGFYLIVMVLVLACAILNQGTDNGHLPRTENLPPTPAGAPVHAPGEDLEAVGP